MQRLIDGLLSFSLDVLMIETFPALRETFLLKTNEGKDDVDVDAALAPHIYSCG